MTPPSRVTRIGDTARRPRTENSDFVHRVLQLLESHGAHWAPRSFGFDPLDREVHSWVPGETPTSGDQVDLPVLTAIVRQLHDLTASLAEDFECVIHDDLQPRNLVVRGREPVALIDWEQARLGRRVDDAAKLCWVFIEPRPDSNPNETGQKWRAVADDYGLTTLTPLLPTILSQVQTCAQDIERLAQQSDRHQALADRDDHTRLRALHAWIESNEQPLREAVEN